MVRFVVRICHQRQILQTIVSPHLIYVMDHFVPSQASPDLLFHYQGVDWDVANFARPGVIGVKNMLITGTHDKRLSLCDPRTLVATVPTFHFSAAFHKLFLANSARPCVSFLRLHGKASKSTSFRTEFLVDRTEGLVKRIAKRTSFGYHDNDFKTTEFRCKEL